MRRLVILTILAAGLPLAAQAQSYRHGRLRTVEAGVMIQRGTETGTEEAAPNMPFLPGDRVWTDGSGRAEFQFAGGSVVRLDNGSKLDYAAHDEGREEQIALRLWSGALYLHARDQRDPAFDVETPGGIVTAEGRAVVRIDVQSGEMRVSVYEGEAAIEGARGARLSAGERAYARRGEVTEGPRPFDRGEGDEFAAWDDEQQEQLAYAANRPTYVPDAVAPYYGELESHGSWYYETEVGYVWRPYVGAGWQPYYDGRWVWTVYGWTWVPAESWGWATSHFGRWGWNPGLGWYWIPGRTWSPAWVSWAVGGDYIGWTPLGYRDRPVTIFETGRRSGHAVPRGSASARTGETATTPWLYVRRGDVAAPGVARRRVEPDPGVLDKIRIVEASSPARLTRELQVSDSPSAGAITKPRRVSTRPTPGDTVPELRTDPMTTIPNAIGTRRGWSGGSKSAPEESTTAAPRGVHPTDARPVEPTLKWAPEAATGSAPRAVHPTDARPEPRRLSPGTETTGDDARVRRSAPAATPRERPAGSDEAQREVLRPVFKPLSAPRSDAGDRARDRGSDRGGSLAPVPRRAPEDRPRGGEVRPREYNPPAREMSRPPENHGGSIQKAPAPPPPPPAREGAARRHKDGGE